MEYEENVKIPIQMNKQEYDFKWFQMEEVRLGQEQGVDLLPFAELGLNWNQLREIRLGLIADLTVSLYALPCYVSYQMRQIRLGLEAGVDITYYNDPEYDWFQMEEIRLGLQDGLDVSIYARKNYEYFGMRQIRKGLLAGINLVTYREKGYSNRVLREIRRAKSAGVDIIAFVEQQYDYEQLEQIRISIADKLDMLPYIKRETSGSQMKEIRLGLEHKIPVTSYQAEKYNWSQMREIRLGLEHGIDVSWYTNEYYSHRQMREIRLGLEAGIMVSTYTSLMLSATDMRTAREWIIQNGEMQMPREASATPEHSIFQVKEPGIFIEEAGMKAYLELSQSDHELNVEELVTLLEANGIKMGIKKEAIKQAIDRKEFDKKILVAEGKQAVDGINGTYEFLFRTKMEVSPKLLKDGSVDYKNVDFFEQVTANQKIAVYQRATGGEFGYNVMGVLQTPKKGKDLPFLKGKNFTRLDDDITYVSNVDGRIEVDDLQITISQIYTFKGDWNITSGNLKFNGDVEVNGSVGSGVSIEATGDIVISGNVESAVLKAGKQIMVKSGVNASGEAYLEAGDCISGKFFENVKLVCKNDIKANYLLACEVETFGSVIVSGKRGSIIGGVIRAVRGVTAFNIGNIAEIRTVIEIGMNEVFTKQFNKYEQEMIRLQSEAGIFNDGLLKYERNYSPQELENLTIYSKMKQAAIERKEELKKVRMKQEELFKSANKDEFIQVRVSGYVYPGCIIGIHKNNLWVREQAERVVFRMEEGRVAAFSTK